MDTPQYEICLYPIDTEKIMDRMRESFKDSTTRDAITSIVIFAPTTPFIEELILQCHNVMRVTYIRNLLRGDPIIENAIYDLSPKTWEFLASRMESLFVYFYDATVVGCEPILKSLSERAQSFVALRRFECGSSMPQVEWMAAILQNLPSTTTSAEWVGANMYDEGVCEDRKTALMKLHEKFPVYYAIEGPILVVVENGVQKL